MVQSIYYQSNTTCVKLQTFVTIPYIARGTTFELTTPEPPNVRKAKWQTKTDKHEQIKNTFIFAFIRCGRARLVVVVNSLNSHTHTPISHFVSPPTHFKYIVNFLSDSQTTNTQYGQVYAHSGRHPGASSRRLRQQSPAGLRAKILAQQPRHGGRQQLHVQPQVAGGERQGKEAVCGRSPGHHVRQGELGEVGCRRQDGHRDRGEREQPFAQRRLHLLGADHQPSVAPCSRSSVANVSFFLIGMLCYLLEHVLFGGAIPWICVVVGSCRVGG